MAESTIDLIAESLRDSGSNYYPQHGEVKNVRVVGHTPRSDHFIYDICLDFTERSERIAAKIYRKGSAQGPKVIARHELANISRVHAIFEKKKLSGVPRPIGDFTELGAVVMEKFAGLPLQSIIMKAALLPSFDGSGAVGLAARQAGEWLRNFHRATAETAIPLDSAALLADLEKSCDASRKEGLDDASIHDILAGARSTLARTRKAFTHSAVLHDFTPLNVIIGEKGIGVCDYSRMTPRGLSFQDVANFLAAVEALEKYPFCNRTITTEVQQNFMDAYGVTATEEPVLRVLRMKTLLAMFAEGRNRKESAVRKKVMWATVMKKFIHQSAQRNFLTAA